MSHPAWVCGLKPFINVTAITGNSHTLRGCVDWNSISLQYGLGGMVTPCVGVWIETRSTLLAFLTSSSHPAWVCGLKLITIILMLHRLCHTLRGCVDWNRFCQCKVSGNGSHTLRGCVDWNLYQLVPYIFPQSHTLRGCVDWNLVCRHGK